MSKEGHMTNIYLTDSDEEAIVDFVKDHEELYEKNKDKDMRVTDICQQLQAICKSVQDLVHIPKDSLKPHSVQVARLRRKMTQRQN